MSLPPSASTVPQLQTSLHVKAKTEPSFRFYSLWDTIYRDDILQEASRRCRLHRGAAGVDGETCERVEAYGVERWLGNLPQELKAKTYQPQPLLRVWIPKRNGGQRPLGIATLRDRVVQTARQLLLPPIFEADLLPQQYGFRPGLDAQLAVRRVYFPRTQWRRHEVVDGDLSDYFNTIPHGPVRKCVVRRIADGAVRAVITRWLEAPVMERLKRGDPRRTEARERPRGVPQGAIVPPLVATLYFRRFLLAWSKFGCDRRCDAYVVNSADDYGMGCGHGHGKAAMADMHRLMTRLGLQVNERQTQLVKLPEEQCALLG